MSFPLQRRSPRSSLRQDHVGLQSDQLFRKRLRPLGISEPNPLAAESLFKQAILGLEELMTMS